MQKHLALTVGIILALLSIFMIKVYLDQQSSSIKKKTWQELSERQKMQASVVIATKDIPKGATIEEGMLEVKVVPRQFLQPKAVSSPERILGMVVLAPISKEEQVTLSKLMSSQQARGGSLAMATPVGKRAIAIPVDNISSLMGMIRPGDYVDVIALIPIPAQDAEGKPISQVAVMPLFQNILVLTVGTELGRTRTAADSRYEREERGPASPMITLALSPQEASLIAFVQEQGKIRLTLRSPADSRIEAVQPASWDALFQYLMPQVQQQQQAPSVIQEAQEARKPARTIEVYRGLKRETMALSQ